VELAHLHGRDFGRQEHSRELAVLSSEDVTTGQFVAGTVFARLQDFEIKARRTVIENPWLHLAERRLGLVSGDVLEGQRRHNEESGEDLPLLIVHQEVTRGVGHKDEEVAVADGLQDHRNSQKQGGAAVNRGGFGDGHKAKHGRHTGKVNTDREANDR